MQARVPTYLEAKLGEVYEATRVFLEESPDNDPMAVLVAHVMSADTRECKNAAACLDSEPLLKAGRAYFALLAENDRLPPGEQITEEELALPRALLLDFFLGRADIQHRAQEVLGLIERKFSERAFQQATILLQLFETDQATRIQNERKLFYEDMIQRLGVRRRHPLSSDETGRIKEHFAEILKGLDEDGAFEPSDRSARSLSELYEGDGGPSLAGADEANSKPRGQFVASKTEPGFRLASLDAQTPTLVPDADPLMPLSRTLEWLASEHQIHFSLQVRHPAAIRRWEAVARLGQRDKAQAMTRAVPPARWRSPSNFPDLPLIELIGRHMSATVLREYVRTLTRACYFVLLAVGDTGLEDYIDTYFGWLEARFSINGTEFIDRLHRESTLGEQTLLETLDAIFDDFFSTPMATLPFSLTEAQIHQAIRDFLVQMSGASLGEVAPGYFDLGGFLLDHLLNVPYPTREFPFRLHRIV